MDDLVDGLIRLAKSDTIEPVNLGNPAEIAIAETADIVEQMPTSTERTYEQLPQRDPTRRRPDITRARPLLSWESEISLVDGLARTIEYLRSVEQATGS